MAGRVFKIDLALQVEAAFFAQDIGCKIVDRWKGVQVAPAFLIACQFQEHVQSLGSDSLALVLRQYAPAAFPDRLALPYPFPESDRADARFDRFQLDDKHVYMANGAILTVTFKAPAELLRCFRSTDVLRHGWVAEQAFEQRQV